MSNRTIAVDDALYTYLLDIGVKDSDVLRELRAHTAAMPEAGMQIAPEQGQFMFWLLQTLNARRTIEVGVFTGYSTLVTAMALPQNGEVVACDISVEYTAIAREFWQRAGVASRIDLQLRPALDTLVELLQQGRAGQFDFAFIDADKENYLAYYEAILPLLRVGGVIAIDNVLWSGRVIDAADNDSSTVALREFNRVLRDDQRIALSVVPIGDGLTLARKL